MKLSKLFLTMFLATGVPLGVAMVATFGTADGVLVGVRSGLIYGFFMAIFMTAFFFVPSEDQIERYGDVHQTRRVELPMPYERAFNLCVSSISSVTRCAVTSEDRGRGRIDARVGMTLRSCGEMVSVQIEQAGEGHTVVDIASRPRLRIIIDDWGKNKDNVERIAAFLQSEAAKAS